MPVEPKASNAVEPKASTPIVRSEQVTKIYQQDSVAVHALRKVDLEIERGAFMALVGPSGSGKTTLLNLARHYLGAGMGYDLTPLLRWDNYAIYNFNDGSRFFSPHLTYSVATDLDWAVGLQYFAGSDGSEYGAFHAVSYAQVQWFF